MNRKVFLAVFIIFPLLFFPRLVSAGDVVLENSLTLYGDVEGFNGPYRQGLTLLGQEFESFFEISKGNHTLLEAGFFADGQEQQNVQFNVNPILSFKYYTDTTKLILGTLENENRHGYLEPLEDSADKGQRLLPQWCSLCYQVEPQSVHLSYLPWLSRKKGFEACQMVWSILPRRQACCGSYMNRPK